MSASSLPCDVVSFSMQAMSHYFPVYRSRSQQDAHEFLGDVLNTLQQELLPYARRVAVSLKALSQPSALRPAFNRMHENVEAR